MGLFEVEHGEKKFTLELNTHRRHATLELPIEKLHAVFLESTGTHPTAKKELERWLNTAVLEPQKIMKIKERAQKSGTEIWFGDISLNVLENLAGALLIGAPAPIGAYGALYAARKIQRKPISRRKALAALLAGGILGGATFLGPREWLAAEGKANTRRISRAIIEKQDVINPLTQIRDPVMAHKVKSLADKTGHTRIGILVGSAHVGIATLLEKSKPLTGEQRRKIAERGPDALKMFRCIYDKAAGRWRVEEHSL